jgi:hypothetical protein
MRQTFALLAAAALAACGKSDNDRGPGGVTVGEARALDEAAQMLEQRRIPAEAPRPTASSSAKSAPVASNAS